MERQDRATWGRTHAAEPTLITERWFLSVCYPYPDSAGGAPHRGQPQPIARGDELGGRHPADPWAARPPAAEAEGTVRGPAVRYAAESKGPQGAGHRGPSGATADA